MKNQYFGDINDYRKYGLLRSILTASKLRLMVAWMLTPDDGSTDGKFISYLDTPKRWAHFDPVQFETIRGILSSHPRRQVALIAETDLLANTYYFSEHVPDLPTERGVWFSSLLQSAAEAELVFLDPDNGIETKSKPYGTKDSSKFVFWREIEQLWTHGKSLLIYQHFIRERRINFVQRMLATLHARTPNSLVEAFSTPHVVFLMALQQKHQYLHADIVETVQRKWAGQIHHWELIQSQHEIR